MDIIKKYLVILLTLMAINSQAKVSANIDGTEPCPVTFSEASKSVDSYGNSSHAPMRRVSVPIGTVVLHVDIDEDGNTYKTIQLR